MTDTSPLDLEPELATAAAASAAVGEFRSILCGDDIDVAGAEPSFFADLNTAIFFRPNAVRDRRRAPVALALRC
jgi:hypothetical protein